MPLLLLTAPVQAGWVPLARTAPGAVNLTLLLSDGTVMAQNLGGNSWYRLAPDIHGSYVNGTWTTLAPMHDTRLYYSSAVLRDGRVFVAGGEYGTGVATAEVYDPLSNTWTLTPSSGQTFLDSSSVILPSGNVLVAPVFPSTPGGTFIYNPTANTWLAGGPCLGNQDEASWVKLPDDSILTVDTSSLWSERYIPSLNQWVDDAIVPVPLFDGEIGPAMLLPDGRALFLGGTGHTALYTPSGTTSPGTWVAGPDIPGGLGTPDAPAAVMVNGKVLCAVGTVGTYMPPTSFFEYDPVANSFTPVSGPTGSTDNVAPYQAAMLDLPDGSVLYSHMASDLYVYRPEGMPLTSGKPTINGITQNSDGSYHLTGTQLNGNSQGAAYGDDFQMDSNYPLVRMIDSGSNVYYARTYNWSSTSVMTGNKLVSTEFTLPAGLPQGTYWLAVVANGISSDPIQVNLAKALELAPPTGLTPGSPYPDESVTVNSSPITLSWQSSAGADRYQLVAYYWDWTGGYWVYDTTITTTANSVSYSPPVNKTHYAWTVQAGNPSRWSDWANRAFFYGDVPCAGALAPASASFSRVGGIGSVSVSAMSGCDWTAQTKAHWITITSAGSGTGNGTVRFDVAANPSKNARTATVTIAGQTFIVTQTGK